MSQERCDACRFWQRVEKGNLTDYENTPPYVSEDLDESDPDFVGLGYCRRFPPVLNPLAMQDAIDTINKNHHVQLGFERPKIIMDGSQQPVTWEFDWCGEFKPRP